MALGQSWSSNYTSTDTSFTLSTGTYDDVQVKSIDVAGNEKIISLGAIKIDSRTLTAPTITSMDDNVNSAFNISETMMILQMVVLEMLSRMIKL